MLPKDSGVSQDPDVETDSPRVVASGEDMGVVEVAFEVAVAFGAAVVANVLVVALDVAGIDRFAAHEVEMAFYSRELSLD